MHRTVKLLCFSDSHGCVEAVKAMVKDVKERAVSYDAVIVAGDITNLVFTKNIFDAQQRFEDILTMLSDEIGPVYYVAGNRDRTGRGKNSRTLDFNKGIYLVPGKAYELDEGIKITSSTGLADQDTILVQHSNVVYAGRFDRTSTISKKALLHIAGHTHTGVWTANYLNTGFLYRDSSNGADPMMGGYFDVEIDGRNVSVSFNALGPIKRKELKSDRFKGYIFAPYGHAFPVKLAEI